MKISRENYETWFADWLDNKLTEGQLEELEHFLNENPDLRLEFENLSEIILDPLKISYSNKDKLIRQPSEIPDSQFELLCVADLEGDLERDQLSELSEIKASDSAREKTAELIALTRLKPPDWHFQNKKRLLRKTFVKTLILYYGPALSAAAVIAIIIFTGIFRQRTSNVPLNTLTIAVAPPEKLPYFANPPAEAPAVNKPSITQREKPVKSETAPQRKSALEKVTSENSPGLYVTFEKINIRIKPVIDPYIPETVLANGPSYNFPVISYEDEGRSRIGKFIARTLREKVLDEKVPSDTRLKGYEIAEAGITGLNKILGWEMALTKNTDDNGQTNSVYFNSRLLKFNAPVKNNELGE